MSLYVYAILGERPVRPGKTIRIVACAGLFVAVAARRAAPDPTEAALREHDAVVRRLAARAEAILPARFGTMFDDAEALASAITPIAPRMRDSLAKVRGREQMTLRVLGDAPLPPARRPSTGTEYLTRSRVAADSIPGVVPLRSAIAPFVRAEKIELGGTPPVIDERVRRARSDQRGRPKADQVIATLYHLVDRKDVERYRATAADSAPGIRISGPFPPYAFAADVLP